MQKWILRQNKNKIMIVSAETAVSSIRSFDKVYIHSVAAAPQALINAMTARAPELKGVEIYQLHTEGEAPYANPELMDSFHVKAFFVGKNIRHTLKAGNGSYIPVFLSEVPRLFREDIINLNVALISVSPPDKHGFCSLGTSVDVTIAALESAELVIAQVNKYMPRTHGDSLIHKRHIDYMVEYDEELHEAIAKPLTPGEIRIGQYIAELIENGSCLQMGIGNIPNAVLASLNHHKNLGIHTEMFSDGIIPLVEREVITGANKVTDQYKIVSSFVMGSKKLYDFIDDNPLIEMLLSQYVNDPMIIKQNPKVVAINSAVEVDLSGQVCADSIGTKLISGVGGQMDFIRAASLSERGKPIIALLSITKSGVSKIVNQLQMGAGVVTTRAHVHYIVTEFGVAYLYGKSLYERAKAMIEIAHPSVREELEREAYQLKRESL